MKANQTLKAAAELGIERFMLVGDQGQHQAITALEIKHVCQSSGAVIAVHNHSSYQEVKDCLRGMKPLCNDCAR